jgi:hypothetical protein
MNAQNRDGSSDSPPRETVRNVGLLYHRLISLMELQAALLKVDAKESLASGGQALLLFLGGALFGLSGVLVLLIAVAQGFREWAGWNWTWSYFAAALLGLTIAASGFLTAWSIVRKSLAVFQRSRDEFQKNLTWLKETLKPETLQEDDVHVSSDQICRASRDS